MVLLLILFAGSLASCAAQTSTVTPEILPSPSSNSQGNVVAFIEANLLSTRGLNVTEIGQILRLVFSKYQVLLPNLQSILTIKNVTQGTEVRGVRDDELPVIVDDEISAEG